MTDFLDVLAQNAEQTINTGYYTVVQETSTPVTSLKKGILKTQHNPIITEIKAASPSLGTITENLNPIDVAHAMEKGGAVGISVLTEPTHFKGSLRFLTQVRKAVTLPILMKDIIVNPIQLEAASKLGANAVLLIEPLFERGYGVLELQEMIGLAHSKNLEVLLETHEEAEYQRAMTSGTDLIGINNRDLRTLKVDIEITKQILAQHGHQDKIVVSESGIKTPADLRYLRESGAHAFLIGSAIMVANDVKQKVQEFARTP